MTLCGAILAGGDSRRMGSPKHAMRLADGRTFLEAVASALRGSCEALAIVGLREPKHALAARELFPKAALLHDTRPGEGPLAGIEALLMSQLADAYIVCSCDMVMLTPDVISALAQPCAEMTATLHLEGEATSRPLPCRVHARALHAVTALLDDEQRAVRFLHQEVGAKVIHGPAAWAAALTDVNTPSDLAWANDPLASSSAHHSPLEPKSLTRRRSSARRLR